MKDIDIQDYNYNLPDSRIAKYPLENRDDSKLLLYEKGEKKTLIFKNISSEVPSDAMLIFNETKVIHARLFFRKETGAMIEVFVLEPYEKDVQMAYQQKGNGVWKCMVGNAKRWKDSPLKLQLQDGDTLEITKKGKEDELFLVEFSWNNTKTFIELLDEVGKIPLPPYLNREAEEDDKVRYQTVFAKNEGSVAAPTAGLHFTNEVITQLTNNGVKTEKVTLHVGAGTFKPVSENNVKKHHMHNEKIVISRQTIQRLYEYAERKFTPVGTTAVRTLESLYWFAVKLVNNSDNQYFDIPQWYPYESHEKLPDRGEALQVIMQYMDEQKLNYLKGNTQLIIVPGYQFSMTDAIITNFHQPKSTLLLLVSAFVGEDWHEIYDYALQHDFRFLSYGDSCYLKEGRRIINDEL